jgi:PadR family transcriptional regulator AphA
MPASRSPTLAEWLILGLIAEQPIHGFALARLVQCAGPIGSVYEVSKPVVYGAIDRLVQLGLVEGCEIERGSRGPQRVLMRATPAGQHVLRRWLNEPVEHVRDLRTGLMAKLVLLARAGEDVRPLVLAQRQALEPIVNALSERRQTALGFDRTIVAWRHHSAQAAIEFLDHLDEQSQRGRSARNGAADTAAVIRSTKVMVDHDQPPATGGVRSTSAGAMSSQPLRSDHGPER